MHKYCLSLAHNPDRHSSFTHTHQELFEAIDREHHWPVSEEGAPIPEWIRFTPEQALEARATTAARPSQVHRPAAADGPFIIKGGTVCVLGGMLLSFCSVPCHNTPFYNLGQAQACANRAQAGWAKASQANRLCIP